MMPWEPFAKFIGYGFWIVVFFLIARYIYGIIRDVWRDSSKSTTAHSQPKAKQYEKIQSIPISEQPIFTLEQGIGSIRGRCLNRNPRRARLKNMGEDDLICGICGVYMGHKTLTPNGTQIGYCSGCYNGILNQCGDIKPGHEDWEKTFKQESLKYMVGIDVADGIISEEQGRSECRYLEDLFNQLMAKKRCAKADRQREQEAREREAADLHQSVNNIIGRL